MCRNKKASIIRNQFWALWLNSTRIQMRQYKTNICLVVLPLALMLCLIGFQLLVDKIIQDELGEFSPAVRRPPLQPFAFFIPNATLEECEERSGLLLDDSNGNILYSPPAQGNDLGTYGGVPRDQLTSSILPPDFVDPNPGPATGILGNATSPLLSFIGFDMKTQSRESFTSICFDSPRIVYPRLVPIEPGGKEQLDNIIYKSWYDTNIAGAYDFEAMSIEDGIFSYDIYYNHTLTGGNEVPILMSFITNAIWRSIMSSSPASQLLHVGAKDFPRDRTRNTFDIISLGGPNLYIYVFQLLFPIALQQLTFDKETKLREIMIMMGLKPPVYFIVSYIFLFLLYMISSILAVCTGLAVGFEFWLRNNFFAYFFLLFFWGHTMIALAFFLSVFFTKTRTATVIGYSIVLATGLLAQNLIRDYFTDEHTPDSTIFIVSLIPPFAFFRGLMALSKGVAFNGPGISFSEISHPDYRLDEVYYFLIIEWIILLLLGIYLDNVLPIGPGVKKHPLFFLPNRCKYCCKDANHHQNIEENENDPEDVIAERRRALSDNSQDPVRILNLRKTFPAQRGFRSKTAVDGLTLAIASNECFGFLGPNGAGKSTTINLICGYLRPNEGSIIINGISLDQDSDEVHMQMGVCPQEDILWPDLTGPEHLEFYGRLKGLSGDVLKQQIDYWLEQVNLHSRKTRAKLSREYSGGMRRRLSVAIALMGEPSVVLLDEPTTGLDPASRANLWKVLTDVKSKTSMILTTHSMEEAEALCDRIGIFVSSKLKCVGAPAELKERYGKYFKILITTERGYENKAKRFLKKIAPGVREVTSLAGTSSYEVERKRVKLANIFRAIESNKRKLGILDWGISNTTLEEVFLKITERHTQDEVAQLRQNRKRWCCWRRKSVSSVQLDNVAT